MNQPLFTGACTALVTPFLNHEINYPMLEQLLRRQLDAGIEAIVICGTTGESPALSDEEKLELFRRAKKYVGTTCRIIAGTGSNCTKRAAQLSKKAEQTGVDGLLVVSPYYNKANTDGLYRHYEAIAAATQLPVIVYNVPSRTGMDISPESCSALSRISNIVGIKEASADITKFTKILRLCGERMTVWSGNDDMTVAAAALGAKGVISVLSNVCPVLTQAMTRAALDGDFDTAAALQIQLQPLVETLFSDVNPIPVKAAMDIIGYDCGDCRLPLGKLSEEKRSRLKQLLHT